MTTLRKFNLVWFGLMMVACALPQRTALPTPQLKNNNFPLKLAWVSKLSNDFRNFHLWPLRYSTGIIVALASSDEPETFDSKGFSYRGFDASTGQALWAFTSNNGYPPGYSAFNQSHFFLAGEDGLEVIALDSGKLAWQVREFGQPISSIALSPQAVYVTAKGSLFALDLQTGSQMWVTKGLPRNTWRVLYDPLREHILTLTLDQIYVFDTNGTQIAITPSPTLPDRCFGLLTDRAFYQSNIYCYDAVISALDGSLLKSATEDVRHHYLDVPTIADNRLYIVRTTGALEAIDTSSFETFWRFTPPTSKLRSTVALTGRIGYIMAENAQIYAFDSLTGNELGSLRFTKVEPVWGSGSNKAPISSLVSTGEGIVVAIEDMLYGFTP